MKRLLCLLPILAGCGITLTPGVAQGTISAQAHKRDPIAVIQNADAIYAKRSPELVALKYKKMKASAFSFFRGSAPLFYQDIQGQLDGVQIPIQGDFHLENLGTYQTGGGAIAYDLNDFDEACTAPFSWEVARCAVSIRLAMHEAGLKDASEQIEGFVASYLQHMKRLDGAATLAKPFVPSQGPALTAINQAKQTNAVGSMTQNGHFVLDKKLFALKQDERNAVEAALRPYIASRREGSSYFQIKDAASRIAGTASIGRYRYVVLIEGKTPSPIDDRVLEIKEEGQPAAGQANGNQAQRVLKAINYFLPDPDPMLGSASLYGTDCLVRELQPAKNAVELTELNSQDWPAFLETVAEALARAHARSGKASDILAQKDLGKEIDAFAKQYEDQVEADYKKFKQTF